MLETAMIFGHHMTLQREKEIKIWGKAISDTVVQIQLSDRSASVEGSADEDGNWMLTLPPHKAARDLCMLITDGNELIEYKDIRIGEVWIAGGQSNMEYYLMFDAEKDEAGKEENQDITFFDYPQVSYEEQLSEHDYSRFGIWRCANQENLPYFSAVGYYFASRLQKQLDVPVGIVGCNWGGTPACAWLTPSRLQNTKADCWLNEYEAGLRSIDMKSYQEAFKKNPINDRSNPLEENEQNEITHRMFLPGISREKQKIWLSYMRQMKEKNPNASLPIGPYSEQRPGGLYETMVKKIAPYTARGIIFYQGESDDKHPEVYETVLKQMITCWREQWRDDLPFLITQLAPFEEWLECTGDVFPTLREQQEKVARSMEGVWLCSTSDVGMQWDIHPKRKRPVGERLALLARGHVYAENLLCDPPKIKEANRTAEKISIKFLNGDGLYIKGEELNALELIDVTSGHIAPEQVEIIEDELIIHGNFPNEVTLRFAKSPYYEVNLYNEKMNPAIPFQITV